MVTPEELAASLPAPRDDEPPTLRHDILDELRDHLACAMQRDLIGSPDQVTAERKVRARFGDPAAIALRLYWDAMWEKIMLQRIQLGVTTAIAIGLLALCGLVWQATTSSQQTARELLAANRELLERLVASEAERRKGPPEPPPAAVNPGWNPVQFRLVQEKSGGPPAVGFKVDVVGASFNFEDTSSTEGTVDLGLLTPGSYMVVITAPWGEISRNNAFTVHPGKKNAPEWVCPPAPPAGCEVSCQLDWPEAWQGRDIWIAFEIMRDVRQFGDQHWRNWEEGVYKVEYLVFKLDSLQQLTWTKLRPRQKGHPLSVRQIVLTSRRWQSARKSTLLRETSQKTGVLEQLAPLCRENLIRLCFKPPQT